MTTRTKLHPFTLLMLMAAAALPARSSQGGDESLAKLTGPESPLVKGDVIAFFGDSITQAGARAGGYCKLIAESLEKGHKSGPIKVIYAGISGNRVPNLQSRIERDVLSKKPTVVFIYIGINDVWHSTRNRGTSKQDFDAGLRELIQKFADAQIRVVLCTPSTIGEKTDGSNMLDSMLDEYAEISRKVAKDTDVTLCDLRRAFLKYLNTNNAKNASRGILTTDGVHLNAAGNQFVAAQASAAIATELQRRNSSQPSRTAKSLFNGKDLAGWRVDVPHLDNHPDEKSPFIIREGRLVSLGNPKGHLVSDEKYKNYRLDVEYRFAGKAGNCGVLVHASTPRALYKMFPKSIEVQMHSGNAGDFWCIVEDIEVPEMVKRRGPKEKWGITEGKARRILNLTDGSEKPVGEWNRMVIECWNDQVKVWVNDALVNHGSKCTAQSGRIALQAEGSEVEFRKLWLTPIKGLSDKSP